MADFNPAVAREAALAAEEVLGALTVVARVLENLDKHGHQQVGPLARALREMRDQRTIAEEPGAAMLGRSGSAQENAQRLLSEVGGTLAFEKLRQRAKTTDHYVRVLEQADEKLRELFENTIREARTGFKVVVAMDVLVFVLGVGLLIVSANLAMADENPGESWAAWIAGAGGVLAVVYGRFIARPRKQVEDSVRYLSGSRLCFLAT